MIKGCNQLTLQPFIMLLFAFSAITAPIAGRAHTAGIALFPEVGLIFVLVRYGIAPTVIEVKLHRLALKAHSRLVCLLALQTVTLDFVEPVVLDEPSARA